MQRRWRRWRYKHLTYFFASLIVVAILANIPAFHAVMHELSKAGYLGAFVGGMLYVSSFTAAFGALLLISMTESVPIIPLCILAGLGGLVGDLLIFRFIRSELKSELHHLYHKFGGQFISQLFKRNKPLNWLMPIMGALIIASPLPDEIGVSMLGVSRIKTTHFALLVLMLDIIGIYALLQVTT